VDLNNRISNKLHAFEARLRQWRPLEPVLYAAVSAIWILLMARWFYGSMRWQLYHSIAWAQGATYDPAQRLNVFGLWSAPLDDTFIHFDFARATARGFPFQWIDGNGYSSGGTSLLYPFVLALGMLSGFRGLSIMHFAALLASTCVFATALGLRRSFAGLPRIASYLLPFALLSVGALAWSIFSGMELALFPAFDQLLVTPLRPIDILFGKGLPGVLIGGIEASAIIDELSSRTDHELNDMGIGRSDIRAIAYGTYRPTNRTSHF